MGNQVELSDADRRRQRQYDAIFDTSTEGDTEEDPAVVVEQLKAIRRNVGAHRRKPA